MIEVIKPGLETSIQDYPGRHGYFEFGVSVVGTDGLLVLALGEFVGR